MTCCTRRRWGPYGDGHIKVVMYGDNTAGVSLRWNKAVEEAPQQQSGTSCRAGVLCTLNHVLLHKALRCRSVQYVQVRCICTPGPGVLTPHAKEQRGWHTTTS